MVLRGCLTLSKDIILVLEGVCKSYPSSGGEKILALDKVSVKFESGSLSLVVGPLGSGKSTLLRIAGLLESPTSGSVILTNEDCTNPTPQERLKLIRNEIGIVPPYPSLLPYLTILENVMLPMIQKNRKRAVELLKDLGVENIGLYPNQVTVEEQQRASIARAIVNNPQLLLVDEPTSFISRARAVKVMELLNNLKEDHTILVFTDNMELSNHSDAIYKLNNGVLD